MSTSIWDVSNRKHASRGLIRLDGVATTSLKIASPRKKPMSGINEICCFGWDFGGNDVCTKPSLSGGLELINCLQQSNRSRWLRVAWGPSQIDGVDTGYSFSRRAETRIQAAPSQRTHARYPTSFCRFFHHSQKMPTATYTPQLDTGARLTHAYRFVLLRSARRQVAALPVPSCAWFQ